MLYLKMTLYSRTTVNFTMMTYLQMSSHYITAVKIYHTSGQCRHSKLSSDPLRTLTFSWRVIIWCRLRKCRSLSWRWARWALSLRCCSSSSQIAASRAASQCTNHQYYTLWWLVGGWLVFNGTFSTKRLYCAMRKSKRLLKIKISDRK